jgi:hypothetical protein
VPEILPPTHTTETTFGTVIGIFVGRHPKVANVAVICSELDVAADAFVGFAGLSSEAFSAYYFGDGKSINVVMSFFIFKVCGKGGTSIEGGRGRNRGSRRHTISSNSRHF